MTSSHDSTTPDAVVATSFANLGLSEALLRHLIAENRSRWRRHLPGGQRLDLRVAMQFEADPRLHDRLWMRRILPHRPDPAFLALVDVSGSMRGQKAEATFASLVLLREVCLRCGIPLTVIAFGCGARILQHPHAPDNADTHRSLHCVLQAEAPRTDMHEGLKLAARELSRCPCAHRYLWLFSDGVPDDEAATRAALAGIRQDITSLIALGLGSGTEPLAGLIPGAQVNLTPQELPRSVARLFQTEILAA
ncbi:MAG: VWA domain-containing protein [Caulobacteraceae bacterium]|nr:VWA domain-containing protein [Caulobacteraceae bacterium]